MKVHCCKTRITWSAWKSSSKLGLFCVLINEQIVSFQTYFYSLSNENDWIACTKISPLLKAVQHQNGKFFVTECENVILWLHRCQRLLFFFNLSSLFASKAFWTGGVNGGVCSCIELASLQGVNGSLRAMLSAAYHTFTPYTDAVGILVGAPGAIMHQLLHVCHIARLFWLAVQVTSLAGWRKIKGTASIFYSVSG